MHKIILAIFIILTSFIYGLPNIILSLKLGNGFTPFTLSYVSPIARDESFAYAPEVNYILQGHLFLKDAYVYEYALSPSPFMGESAPSIIFAFLSKLTGSLESSFVAADFIFPPIIFVLLFKLTRIFIKNNLNSLSIAFIATVARDFIAVIPFPHETIQYLTAAENQNYLLYFSRAFHPQLTFIFLSLALITFLKMIEAPRRKYIILSGLLFGILFYCYIFYWTFFSAFVGLLLIYFAITGQRKILKAIIISSILAFTIASPYLYNIYSFYKLDTVADFVAKSSLLNVPLPVTLLRYLFIALMFLIFFKKRSNNSIVFFLFLFAGIIITPVSKLLLGQDLETFHYLRRALMPFATLSLFIVLYGILIGKTAVLKGISVLIIIVFFAFSLNSQITASKIIEEVHTRNSDLESVLFWLKNNTEKSSVVGSLDPNFSSLLPVYTQNKVFIPPTDRTVMPTYEGIERYKIISELLGLDSELQKKNLDDLVSYFFVYQSYNQNRNLDINSPRRQEAEKQIDNLSKNQKWAKRMKNYKLDFLIITPSELEQVKPDSFRLKVVTSINRYIVLKVK